MIMNKRRRWTFPGLLCVLLLIPLLLVIIQLVLWKSSVAQPQATYLDISDQDIKQLLMGSYAKKIQSLTKTKTLIPRRKPPTEDTVKREEFH